MTPNKYPQNLHTPKSIHYLKTPENIEIQNFEPQRMTRAYVCMKISEYPPLGVYHRLKSSSIFFYFMNSQIIPCAINLLFFILN